MWIAIECKNVINEYVGGIPVCKHVASINVNLLSCVFAATWSQWISSQYVVNNNATLSNFNYPWILGIVFFDTTGSFSPTTGVRTLYLNMIAINNSF